MMGSCAIASAKALQWRIAIQLLNVNEARKHFLRRVGGGRFCGEGAPGRHDMDHGFFSMVIGLSQLSGKGKKGM